MKKEKIKELREILERNSQVLDSLHPLEKEVALKISGLNLPTEGRRRVAPVIPSQDNENDNERDRGGKENVKESCLRGT